MNTPYFLLGTCLLFLLLSAFFSASETALFSIPREKIRRFKGTSNRSQKQLYSLLDDGPRTLYMLLLGNLFVNITLTGTIHTLISYYTTENSPIVTLGAATVVIVIFGEMLPKNIALKHNETIGCMVAPLLTVGKVVGRPLLSVVARINQFFLVQFRLRFRQPSPYVTVEELKSSVIESGRSGVLSCGEQELLVNLLDRGTVPVTQCMEHRSQLLLLPHDSTATAALKAVRSSRHTGVFVYRRGNAEQVVGKVNLVSLLKAPPGAVLEQLYEEIYFVPDTMEAAEVLGTLFGKKSTEAAVVDEYGSFEGVVSLENGVGYLLNPVLVSGGEETEVLLGVMRGGGNGIYTGDSEVVAMGWLPKELQTTENGIRTLSGALTKYLGSIPAEGDKFAIEGWSFYILSASPVKIKSVFIKKRHEYDY